jgi:hypothetical protein
MRFARFDSDSEKRYIKSIVKYSKLSEYTPIWVQFPSDGPHIHLDSECPLISNNSANEFNQADCAQYNHFLCEKQDLKYLRLNQNIIYDY